MIIHMTKTRNRGAPWTRLLPFNGSSHEVGQTASAPSSLQISFLQRILVVIKKSKWLDVFWKLFLKTPNYPTSLILMATVRHMEISDKPRKIGTIANLASRKRQTELGLDENLKSHPYTNNQFDHCQSSRTYNIKYQSLVYIIMIKISFQFYNDWGDFTFFRSGFWVWGGFT